MRKNRMMRLASALLILTMVTTCAISGTFAKYVTSDSAKDSARVAKWGVTVEATGDEAFFAEMYGSGDAATTEAATATVDSSTTDKVVAPGTAGTLGTVTVTGQPEVDVTVVQTADLKLEGWTINTDEYYCPIIITIGTTDYVGTSYVSMAKFEEAIEGALATNETVQSNVSLASTYDKTITWKWLYTGGDGQTDEKDTALGNLATAPTIEFTYTTTVTQID